MKNNKQILKNMKNQKKQTAVEWIEDSIQLDMTIMEVLGLIRQAKEMEKEQIMDANFYGQRLHAKSVTNTMMENNAEGYYNETFNTKEK